jgi:sigma-B regulation protein RsbU (phosphoserine phosphatase)
MRERIDLSVDARSVVEIVAVAAAAGMAIPAYKLGRARLPDPDAVDVPRRASSSGFPHIPGVSIASVVLSASPGSEVGGDIVDVFALDGRFAMLLVADVSGKGVEAAAHTAFIRYTLRALALESDGDPAVVVAKFNAMYARTITDPEAFVVLILGIIDSQTGELRYANAGHEPAFLRRRDGRITLLAPTGPIVGAAPFSAYRSDVVTLGAGDVLVWTTDGMTESRDRERRLLGVDGLTGWIAAAPQDVRSVANALTAALRQRTGGADQDDVAILAVAYDAAACVPGRVTRRDCFPALLRELREPPLRG